VATPAGFVDLAALEPGITIDMRYARADNFIRSPMCPAVNLGGAAQLKLNFAINVDSAGERAGKFPLIACEAASELS
jgi:D-alanyl-D-alanine dipeptidase